MPIRLLSVVNTSVAGRDVDVTLPGQPTDTVKSQRTLVVDTALPTWPNVITFDSNFTRADHWILYTADGGTQAYLARPGEGPQPDRVWGNWPTNTDQSVRATVDNLGNLTLRVASE